VQKTPGLRNRSDRDRIGHSVSADGRPLEGVDRELNLGPFPRPKFFSDIEHRRLIAFSLTDHNPRFHINSVKCRTHRSHSGLVGEILITSTDGARCRNGGGFRHANTLKSEVSIHASKR
jgi:hypothetical protein